MFRRRGDRFAGKTMRYVMRVGCPGNDVARMAVHLAEEGHAGKGPERYSRFFAGG
jgi:hypothetical protein